MMLTCNKIEISTCNKMVESKKRGRRLLTNPDDVERPGEDEEEEVEQEAGEHVAGHRVRHHQTPRGRRHGRTHTAQAATCKHTHSINSFAFFSPPPTPARIQMMPINISSGAPILYTN